MMKPNTHIAIAAWSMLFICVLPRISIADEARRQFERGLVLFQDEQYAAAAAMFRSAHALRPNWRIYYNIGQSETAATQYGLAISSFEKYLSNGGDDVPADRRKEVIEELQQLRQMVGFLSIDAPDDTRVEIDGILRGTTPFSAALPVAASVAHQVTLYRDETLIRRLDITVAGQQTSTVSATDDSDSRTTRSTSNPLKTTAWGLGGVAAASVIAGTITGIATLRRYQTIQDDCPTGCYSDDYHLVQQRDRLALSTDILLGTGILCAAAAAILLGVLKKSSQTDRLAAPVLIHNGAAALVQIGF